MRQIPLPKRTKSALTQKLIRFEYEKVSSVSVPHARKVAMEATGNVWSSEQLRNNLDNWLNNYQMVQFFVGGPDGMDNALIDSADDIL